MADGIVLAVDGGGVKTDLALVDRSGSVLSIVRGGGSSPHQLGVEGCVELLAGLLEQARSRAGLNGDPPYADVAEVMLSGVDFPEERATLRDAIAARGWTRELSVDNDTFALLRAGTERGWGVAVVCGGGINCTGVAPDGSTVRFPALGAITGDWGGGYDIGLAALSAAARGADGRGPQTALEAAVPAHFSFASPLQLARAIHSGELRSERLAELAQIVYELAPDDPVSAGLLARLADEVVAMAGTALRRLSLAGDGADVVLGGSLLRTAPEWMLERIGDGVHAVARDARLVVVSSEPIVGSVLLGLDALGVDGPAAELARAALDGAARARRTGDG